MKTLLPYLNKQYIQMNKVIRLKKWSCLSTKVITNL